MQKQLSDSRPHLTSAWVLIFRNLPNQVFSWNLMGLIASREPRRAESERETVQNRLKTTNNGNFSSSAKAKVRILQKRRWLKLENSINNAKILHCYSP